MTEQRKNKFYWVEGVTRDEVVKSLADQRPTRLRRQRVRRYLVVIYSLLVAVVTGGRYFISGVKLSSYLEFLALAGLLCLYFVLRRSVRHIADAPDELLDERLIQLRDSAYLKAYRIINVAALGFLMVGYQIGKWDESGDRLMSGTIMPFIWLAAGVPAMVLAWQLPSERTDE